MKKLLSELPYIGVFILIVFGFFYQTIFFGKLPVPSDTLVGLYHPWRDFYAADYPRGVPFKNFLITDPVRQQIPWRNVAIDQWKQGQVPVWNAFNFSGAPLLANIQAAVFYPLNILFFLFSFPVAWTILIILQPVLSGLFLYRYLRHKQLHPLSSLFGAIAWSFSGFSIAWLTWGTIGHVALWLPLMLLSVDKVLEVKNTRKKLAWVVCFVLSICSSLFAGHAQVFLYVAMLAALYTGVRLVQLNKEHGSSWMMRNSMWLTSGAAISLIITSIQWLPMLATVAQSGRLQEEANWLKVGWFLPIEHLVQFAFPDFFGNPATLNYWGKWNYGEFIGYIGIVPLVFAVSTFWRIKRLAIRFWVAVLLTALVFAISNPLSNLIYAWQIPVLSSLQPTRLMVLVDFALVMLAVYGFDQWMKEKNKKNIFIGCVIVSLIVVGGWMFVGITKMVINDSLYLENLLVAQRNLVLPTTIFIVCVGALIISRRIKNITLFGNIVTWSIIGLVVFDLFRFGWKFTPFTPQQYFFPTTKTIEFLKSQDQLGKFRVLSLDDRILPPNANAYYGIEMASGYDPIIPGRYEEFMAALERGKPDITRPYGFNRIITPKNIDSPLFPFLNVAFVLSLEDISKPLFFKKFQEGETRVYFYAGIVRRGYFASVRRAKNKEDALSQLFDPLLVAHASAVVEGLPSEQDFSLADTGDIDFNKNTPDGLRWRVYSGGDQADRFFVITVPFDRSHRVLLDGKEVKVYRANYIYQGVVVPPGNHTIEIQY